MSGTRYAAMAAFARAQARREAEQARRAACFDDLVAALERCMPFLDDALDAVQVMSEVVLTEECRATVAAANAALARARGETDA